MNNNSRKALGIVWACFAASVLPSVASAAYVEMDSGDLAGDHLNPTPVVLTPNGSTRVSGSVAGTGNGTSTDLDYFKVTVPAGQFLTGLFVRSNTTTGGNGSFMGLFRGATGTPPASTPSTNLLGYYLYKVSDIDTNNILDDLGTFNFLGTNPSQGFVPPLAPGDYTFWIQEGSNGTFNYNLDFVLSNVPEPASGMALLGATGLISLGRRRTNRHRVRS